MRRAQAPTTDAKFRAMVRELRRKFPPILPVRVYRRELSDALGHAILVHGSHFRIVIHSPMAYQATWQVLIHEWAHCIAWREGHETVSDHDPEWALALSRIYQELIEP